MLKNIFTILALVYLGGGLSYGKELNDSLLDKDTKKIYALNNYQSFWNKEKAEKFLQILNESESEGLNPDDYRIEFTNDPVLNEINLTKTLIKYCKDLYVGRVNPKEIFDTWNIPRKQNLPLNELAILLQEGDFSKISELCEPKFEQYKILKSFLKRYTKVKDKLGEIKTNLKLGKKGKDVLRLKRILYVYGYYKNEENLESDVFDEEVLEAVKLFQEKNNLQADGFVGLKTRNELNKPLDEKIKIIKLNMEKYRWLPETLPSERIEVNIPSFYLRYYKDDEEILSMKVVVGKNYEKDFRPTPVYFGKVTDVTINPYWYVPKTIAVKDILPKVKSNPWYLKSHGFKLLYNGQELDPEKVNWYVYNKDNFPFSLVQKPNDKNSLGKIKISFTNPFGIYLHDTPQKNLFLREKRAYSSGCIRLEDPVKLASVILDKSEEEILELIGRKKTVRLVPKRDIYVYILYFTAEAKDDKITFYEDIYKFDSKILEKMENSTTVVGRGLEPLTPCVSSRCSAN